MANILFPSIRNLSVVPPVINAINHLSESNDITVFSYTGDKDQYHSNTSTYFLSREKYPKKFFQRVRVILVTQFRLLAFLKKRIDKFDYIWVGVNDFYFLFNFLTLLGFKGKTIFHLHELQKRKFRNSKKADFVIVPDENRAWIAYLLAGLKRKPFVLPNIPVFPDSLNDEYKGELTILRKTMPGVKIVLYQGFIDYGSRCILELLQAFTFLDDNIRLVIMPSSQLRKGLLLKLSGDIDNLKLKERVSVINTVKAPYHLLTVKQADLGIGLYRATSLNQVYAAPNRLFEFTRFTIPVILPDFPYFNHLAERYQYAVNTADPGNPGEIAKTIKRVLSPENYKIAKMNSEKFTRECGNYKLYFDKIWTEITSS